MSSRSWSQKQSKVSVCFNTCVNTCVNIIQYCFFCFAQAAAAAECRIQLLAICFAEWNWACEPCSTIIILTESRNRRERSNYQTRGGGTEAKEQKGCVDIYYFWGRAGNMPAFDDETFGDEAFGDETFGDEAFGDVFSVKRCAMECQEKMLSFCWANSWTKFLWRMLLMSNWSMWPLSL